MGHSFWWQRQGSLKIIGDFFLFLFDKEVSVLSVATLPLQAFFLRMIPGMELDHIEVGNTIVRVFD